MSLQIFGRHAVIKVLERQPEAVKELWLLAKKGQKDAELETLVRSLGIHPQFVDAKQLDRLTQNAVHQGVVAQVSPPKLQDDKDLLDLVSQQEKLLLLYLDEIQDPHNLGAILRTADAAGVDGVVWGKNNQVGITPIVAKVASGALWNLKLFQVTNLTRSIKTLQQEGVWVYALDERGAQTVFYTAYAPKTLLIMGAEGRGLRQLVKETADELISIPMYGTVESLNVSVATGIALYAVVNHRHGKVHT